MINRTVSHYRITKQIGAGGMGVVYEAEDTILKRRVAVKTLKDSNVQKSRLLREAQAISNINHPNIATVYDFGETDERQPFIVMELVEGKPLDEFIKDNELDLSQIINIIIKTADALATAHKHGIIHRDIKPSNILITEDEKVKVLDFGLSKRVETEDEDKNPTSPNRNLEATRTQEGFILGTPLYLSPEQAMGERVDERSDIFSLGTLLYESITGKSPFYAESVIEICAKVLRDNPPPPSEINQTIPLPLDRITLKTLAKEPDQRYQTTEALIADLSDLQKNLPRDGKFTVATAPITFKPSIARRLRTNLNDALRRPLLLGAIFSTLVLIGLAAFVFRNYNRNIYQPPPLAKMWYERGERALNDGLFFSAKRSFEETVKQDPNFVMARAGYTESLLELGYTENAREEREHIKEIVSGSKFALPPQDDFRIQAINQTLLSDFDAAVKTYRELIKYSDETTKAQAYLYLGRALERDENLPEAIESYRQAIAYNPDSASANLRLGILSGRSQEFEKANAFFSTAERLYRVQNDSEGEIEVNYQRGLLLSTRDDATKALEEVESSLKRAEINGIDYQQIKCLMLMSRILRSSGRRDEALDFAARAAAAARQKNITYLQVQSLFELGTIYLFLYKYDDAKNNYDEALRLARQNNLTVLEKKIVLQFGSFYAQQHRADEALDAVNQVQEFFEKAGYQKEMFDLLSIKAQALAIKGDFKTALESYQNMLTRAAEVGDQIQKARAQKGIGTMLARQDDLSNALPFLNESYSIYNSIHKTSDAGYSLIAYADILWQLGRYGECEVALNQAEGLAVAHPQLLPLINLTRAKKFLSERNFDRTIEITKQIIAADPELKKSVTIEAKSIFALALLRSGQKSKAAEAVGQINLDISKIEEAETLPKIYLARAEIMLENNSPDAALEDTRRACESANKLGKPSLEWIGWLLESFAERQLKNFTAAKQSSARADVVYSTLSQKWKPEDFKSYSERPDIKSYRERLSANVSQQ